MCKIIFDALAILGVAVLAILVWGLVKIYRSEQPQQTTGPGNDQF